MDKKLLSYLFRQRQAGIRWLFVFVFITTSSFQLQNYLAVQSNSPGKQNFDVDWQLDATVSGVQFYHSITGCNGKKVVFLKFVNTNNYQVKIAWKEVFATQADQKVEGFLGQKKLLLSPGETSETDCENARRKECLILPSQVSPTYNADILKFDYKEITVSKS
jgi:hypothetical protein